MYHSGAITTLGPILKYWTSLKKLFRDKHSSLFCHIVSDEEIKYDDIYTRSKWHYFQSKDQATSLRLIYTYDEDIPTLLSRAFSDLNFGAKQLDETIDNQV